MTDPNELMSYTAKVVSAFVGNNNMRADELPELIATVHASLASTGAPPAKVEPVLKLSPAVPIRKSITDDHIISLEDGRKFKSMKRHLALLGMTPDDYRAKWDLPRDYPMVAPAYATKRSELAKVAGLGRKPAQETKPAVTNGHALKVPEIEPALAEVAQPEAAAAPKKRLGRPRKIVADLMEATALTPVAADGPIVAESNEATPAPVTPVKRRGRPRKVAEAASA